MGENTTLNPGSGGDVIATEDPGLGYKIPVSKIRLGALDVDGGDVTPANPFPISLGDGVNTVTTASVNGVSTMSVADDTARLLLEQMLLTLLDIRDAYRLASNHG